METAEELAIIKLTEAFAEDARREEERRLALAALLHNAKNTLVMAAGKRRRGKTL